MTILQLFSLFVAILAQTGTSIQVDANLFVKYICEMAARGKNNLFSSFIAGEGFFPPRP